MSCKQTCGQQFLLRWLPAGTTEAEFIVDIRYQATANKHIDDLASSVVRDPMIE
jgi:hypothetical protein